jgi:RNA polymerase sigma-32 factor
MTSPSDDAPDRALENQVEVETPDQAPSEPASTTAVVPSDALQRYLGETRRYPILSREEEHELALRYCRDQDREAAFRLVASNLRLVVMIAREYQRASQSLLDLIQEGNIGLMEAVKNFDPYRGVRFPSYAVWWIRAYIIRYIMNNWRMVKLGTTQAQRKLFFNLQKEKELLEREGISPGPKLLAQRLDVKEREVVEMEQRLSAGDLSIDSPIADGEEASLVDFLPSGEQTAEHRVADAEVQSLLSEKIAAFGSTLQGKERVIFERRLLSEEPGTLQELGDEFGISRERVRQLESRIKKRLKEYLLREFKDLKDIYVRVE